MTRSRIVGAFWVLLTLTLTVAWSGPASAAPLDVASFFSNSEISGAKLSPSGRYLAIATASKTGRIVLAVASVDALEAPVVVAGSPAADIRSFNWVNDDYLVYNVLDYGQAGAYQNFGPGLFSVKRDGSGGRVLIDVHWNPVSSGSRIGSNTLDRSHGLLFVPTNDGTEVIVGQYRFDNLGELISVTPKRLDVVTGRATLAVVGYPAGTQSWVFDRTGEARAAVAETNGMVEVFWRDKGTGAWRSLVKAPELNMPWEPYAVDAEDRLYVRVPGADSVRVLKRFDFAKTAPDSSTIVSTPGFDFAGVLEFDPDGKRLIGVRVDTDAATTVWLDASRKKLQDVADARFPGRINQVLCSRQCPADGVVLVFSYSDRDAGGYHLYSPATSAWSGIGSVRPGADPRQMAQLDLHRFKARDGLDIPVWVTKPRGADKTPRPAVVLVHGGPFVRGGSWGWDAEAQFLASRGYVVIEPEFRGSRGFGENHFRAGWKNWGTTMQDDVADAMRWAADQGLIDPKRVCIAGASYGGYATLMGPIRHPDLYRCGVAWVAVSDPRLLFEESWQNDIGRDAHFSMRATIGDPVLDAALLKAAAPVERASEVKIPILLAYGSNDVRVPLEHGNRMRAALKAAGNDPEYVVYEGEGHGWLLVKNRIDFWTRVEKFLAKHIGN